MRRPPLVVSDGTAVLAKLKLSCREPAVGARPVKTARATCSVPLDVMAECRAKKEPFPDPHEWRPSVADAQGPWWRCAICGDVTRIAP